LRAESLDEFHVRQPVAMTDHALPIGSSALTRRKTSSTTTDRPARESVSAADNPAYPAPMIATSQLFGSATSIGDSSGAASHQ